MVVDGCVMKYHGSSSYKWCGVCWGLAAIRHTTALRQLTPALVVTLALVGARERSSCDKTQLPTNPPSPSSLTNTSYPTPGAQYLELDISPSFRRFVTDLSEFGQYSDHRTQNLNNYKSQDKFCSAVTRYQWPSCSVEEDQSSVILQ